MRKKKLRVPVYENNKFVKEKDKAVDEGTHEKLSTIFR